jgi:fructokinase
MPGVISPQRLVKNANSPWLIGRRLRPIFSRRLGREVRCANDANCFALSEAVDGAAAGASVVFGVIVGTGTGGGIVVNGRVLTGANAIAGELGAQPAAVAVRGRMARAGLLLRPHRFASRRSCLVPAWRATSPASGGDALEAPDIARARPRAMTWRSGACGATNIAWPGRSPPSSTCSIPT